MKNLKGDKPIFLIIFSSLTISITAFILFLTVTLKPPSFSKDMIEQTLNIKIDCDYSVEINEIIRHGRKDYKAKISIKLTDESLANQIKQIEKAQFYNLKLDFYGNDEKIKKVIPYLLES
ncbi:hypothetical protein ACS6L2_12290 [Aquirufa ecclesiirivi]